MAGKKWSTIMIQRPLQQRITLACQLNDELPFQTLRDSEAAEHDGATFIPLHCIQTAESNQFGRSHHKALINLRKQNPHIRFLLFDKIRRDNYMATSWSHHPIHDLYRRSVFGVMQADIFRYCAIYDMGGFYLDINKILTKPLGSFISSTDEGLISFENNWCQLPATPRCASTMQHPDRYVVQWCFAFAPNHMILKNMLNNICDYSSAYENKIFASPSEAIRSLTGPGLFTKTVRDFFSHAPGRHIRQAGIDFSKSLQLAAGSSIHHVSLLHYKEARNQAILSTKPIDIDSISA
jgi:mannosyltransferase OCH1-like enzyme